MRITCLIGFVLAGPFLSLMPGHDETTPPELGAVCWERAFDKAADAAKETNKPLLVLFQEVPG